MIKANVVNGFVEYIARKMKENRPVTVRVLLNDVAKSILEKYKDLPDQQLLPFTSQQQYNRDIKTAILQGQYAAARHPTESSWRHTSQSVNTYL